ncbi:hypothetical protein BAE44_0003451 [Dichanthelium oligosanthes]|uniref:No apical meristem-associated C-terminal domain-containing protein n=1 Tax=Dichanthelium oligosanthes TaxID=888268 RepID=A0A1E5WDP8_9POAL|nr:hypothetical protein BAE44_0003451 [Dichanthelium oligosanthes]
MSKKVSSATTGATLPPRAPAQQNVPAPSPAAVDADDAHQLFEEMSPSNPMAAGGGFFADVMGDAISIENFSASMPYEPDEYANEAGFEVPTPTAKKVRSRSSNYTAQEDTALIMAWESITLDAVKGIDQTSSTCWMRIYDHYHSNKKCVSNRSLVSLNIGGVQFKNVAISGQVAWSRLSVYTQVISIALELYKEKKPRKGKPFVMLHCWSLLQHNQKWLTRNDEAPPKRQKSSNSSLEFEGFQDVDNDRVQDEDGRDRSLTPSSGAPTRKRPPGRKAEKERLKRGPEGGAYKEVFK